MTECKNRVWSAIIPHFNGLCYTFLNCHDGGENVGCHDGGEFLNKCRKNPATSDLGFV